MNTRELVEALQTADPGGYRKVAVEKVRKRGDDTVTTDLEVVCLKTSAPSELHPLVLELEEDY